MSPNPWTLLVLLAEGDGPDLALPDELSGWRIHRRRLQKAEPGDLDPDLLLITLSPETEALHPWLARFRVLHPKCSVSLAETEVEQRWYRAAIRLGVDELLPLPMDGDAWREYLADYAEALQTGAEQHRLLGRLERSTQSLEESRRQLAEMLLKSYENLGQVHAQLSGRLDQLSVLYQLGRDLSLESNWDQALEHFLGKCVETLDFKGVALLLWSFDEHRLAVRSSLNLSTDELESALPRLRELPSGLRRGGESLGLGAQRVLKGAQLDPGLEDWELTVLPLAHGGEAQGFLIYRKHYESGSALASDFHFLKTVQTLLGEELANAKSIHRLKRLGELNRSVLESVPAAVLTVDGRGRIAYRNPQAARLFGERLAVDQPWRFDEDFHLLDGEESGPGQEAWIQRECRLRSGTEAGERRLLLSTTLLPQRHESDPRIVMVCEDLTDYQRLEAQLRQAERLSSLGQLSAGMAHEIRNPLAGIAMTAQVLRTRLDAQDDARPFLDRIQEETQRLERIVRSLLDLSRPATPEFRALDLQGAAERALEAARGRALERGVILDETTGNLGGAAWADRDQVHQVLLNLLLNAVEACAAGDRVGLRVERAAAAGGGEGRLRLVIYDTGPGIAEALRERLFDPFFTTKAEGTGLGLSICQKIMEEHGGSIRHRPLETGGTEFVVDLAPAVTGTQPEEAIL